MSSQPTCEGLSIREEAPLVAASICRTVGSLNPCVCPRICDLQKPDSSSSWFRAGSYPPCPIFIYFLTWRSHVFYKELIGLIARHHPVSLCVHTHVSLVFLCFFHKFKKIINVLGKTKLRLILYFLPSFSPSSPGLKSTFSLPPLCFRSDEDSCLFGL